MLPPKGRQRQVSPGRVHLLHACRRGSPWQQDGLLGRTVPV